MELVGSVGLDQGLLESIEASMTLLSSGVDTLEGVVYCHGIKMAKRPIDSRLLIRYMQEQGSINHFNPFVPRHFLSLSG